MKNKRLKRNFWVSIPCFLFSVFYILYFVAGCGLNNPFTPPTPRGPSLIYPKNGDELDIGKTTFLWDVVPGREEYQFQLSKSANFTSFIVNTNLVNSLPMYEHTFSGTDTTEYFWRVKVKYKVPSMWSKWSDIWSLVICPGIENHPPVTPYNPSPSDSATEVSTMLTLSWTSGDPDGDIVNYTIYFGKDSLSPESTFTTVDPSRADTTTVLYPLSYSLDFGAIYYWKVEARDQHTMSAGPMWRFTTSSTPNEPPNKPQTPTGPSWVYADKSCTFTTSTTDPEGDNVAYIFNFGDGTISNWTPLVASGETGSADHIYTRLGTFYVKAQAKDKGGRTSEWSDSISILVKADSGTCWVGEYGGCKVLRISAKGSRLCELEKGGLSLQTYTLDVDPQTGWCWEASTYENRTHRIPPNCEYDNVVEGTFGGQNPSTPCVDGNGYCWYVFITTKKLVKFDENFAIIEEKPDPGLGMFTFPSAAAIDLGEQALWVAENDESGGQGYVSKFLCSGTTYEFRKSGFKAGKLDVDQVTHWCWVPDNGNNQVAKISSDGNTVTRFDGFNKPSCVSVDSYTHCCWVADELNNRVVKLSETGVELCVATGLTPFAVETDPLDHGCWVSDKGNNRVVKLDANCNTLFTVDNILIPAGLSVNPNPDP